MHPAMEMKISSLSKIKIQALSSYSNLDFSKKKIVKPKREKNNTKTVLKKFRKS